MDVCKNVLLMWMKRWVSGESMDQRWISVVDESDENSTNGSTQDPINELMSGECMNEECIDVMNKSDDENPNRYVQELVIKVDVSMDKCQVDG